MKTISNIQNPPNNSPQQHHLYDLNDKSWQVSTWTQRACLATGCTTLLITLAKCISLAINNHGPWLELIIVAFIGYLFADLTTGVFHWAIDNYGSPQTPIFGAQIEASSRHHKHPWALAKQHVARNLDVLSVGTTVVVMPVNVASRDPVVLGFLFFYAGGIMFCQLFHAWAHTPEGKLPSFVAALQNAGVLVSRSAHAAHHLPPYNNSYCIVSGFWNRFLTWSRFFLVLEVVIFNVFGVEPRSWNDLSRSHNARTQGTTSSSLLNHERGFE